MPEKIDSKRLRWLDMKYNSESLKGRDVMARLSVEGEA